MEKKCANCGTPFTCREDSIIQCHCASVKLNDAARDFLKVRYKGCLCNKCLRQVKARFADKE